MASETASGDSIAAQLTSGATLLEKQAVELTIAACDGLSAIHAVGLIHRSINPHTIYLHPEGHPIITSLGLERPERSQARQPSRQPFEPTAYLSPEQARCDQAIDQRTDIYSLAATLYTMLGGEPPFEGKNNSTTLTAILKKSPKDLKEQAPHISAPVCHVVMRALAKSPDERPHSAQQFARDLHIAVNATRPFRRASGERPASLSSGLLKPQAPQQSSSHFLPILLVGTILTALILAVILASGINSEDDPITTLRSTPVDTVDHEHLLPALKTIPAVNPELSLIQKARIKTGSNLQDNRIKRILPSVVAAYHVNIHNALLRAGYTVTDQTYEGGLSVIEGLTPDQRDYRVKVFRLDDHTSQLEIKSGGDIDRQAKILNAIRSVTAP